MAFFLTVLAFRTKGIGPNFIHLGPVYMRRAGPLASCLANKQARLYMRDSIVSQHRASPAISSHVPSFFCVKLKEHWSIFWLMAPNVILRVRRRRAGPFLLLYEKSQPAWGGIPVVDNRDLGKVKLMFTKLWPGKQDLTWRWACSLTGQPASYKQALRDESGRVAETSRFTSEHFIFFIFILTFLSMVIHSDTLFYREPCKYKT